MKDQISPELVYIKYFVTYSKKKYQKKGFFSEGTLRSVPVSAAAGRDYKKSTLCSL